MTMAFPRRFFAFVALPVGKSTDESGRDGETLGLADRMQQRVRREAVAPLRALAEVAVRSRALVGGLVQTCVEIKI